ncbi:hypothetical protein AGMMS50268_15720 [Spirochaetia bacterium]|nr:hypothetical protein AGMMS50268_15720 [Spirochaetia bacterium]
MDLTGFLDSIVDYVDEIGMGRKGLATDGEEHAGRIHYERGISGASNAFHEAQNSADPQIIVLSELVFLQQELQFCNEADTDTRSSLTQAIQSFEDALRSLQAVADAGYKIAEKTYPQNSKYRIQGFPKDAFHLACIAHRTRLRNVLRSPGINMIEKAVLHQRAANLTAAQDSYITKQEAVLQ